MSGLGKSLFFIGLVSLILNFLGLQIRFLFWLDIYGEIMGWVIRLGLMILGGVIWFNSDD